MEDSAKVVPDKKWPNLSRAKLFWYSALSRHNWARINFPQQKKSSSFKYLLAFSRMCFEIFETSLPLCHNSRSNPWWKLHKILLLICSCVTLMCKNMYSFKFKLFWSSALSRHNWAIIKSKLFSVFQISTWTLLWLHHCFDSLEFSLQYFTKTWL